MLVVCGPILANYIPGWGALVTWHRRRVCRGQCPGPGHTRLLVTMEDVSPAPDIPGLWASRPGPASPADDNNYCYKPIKDLFKDFFEQLLVLFIIISRAKRNHYSWKWCTLEAVFALCSLLSASNRKCMAIKSTVLEINVCIRQK